MHEVEIPTEEYYSALRKSMGEKHPKACPFLLDHLLELEAMFDVCIVSVFPWEFLRPFWPLHQDLCWETTLAGMVGHRMARECKEYGNLRQ